MPWPVSLTISRSGPGSSGMSTSTVPPGGVNFTAFDSRFQAICWTRSASAMIGARTARRAARSIRTPLAAAAGATTSIAARGRGDEIDRRQLEAQLAADDPRHVEHVFDQPRLRRGVAVDDAQARSRASRGRPCG